MLNVYKGTDQSSNASGNCIIIDIICATTMITYFFHKGARKVYPARSIEHVIELKKKDPDLIVIGDYVYERPDLFDINIFEEESFKNFSPQGKDIVYISANGTRRIFETENVKKHYIGSFLNFSSLLNEVKKEPFNYCILLAMSKKFKSEEDIAWSDAFNNNLKVQESDFSKYLFKITTSHVVHSGTWIVKAPYLVDIALKKDVTNIIPVTSYDKNNDLVILPLSEV